MIKITMLSKTVGEPKVNGPPSGEKVDGPASGENGRAFTLFVSVVTSGCCLFRRNSTLSLLCCLQGYLAHKKHLHPRTLHRLPSLSDGHQPSDKLLHTCAKITALVCQLQHKRIEFTTWMCKLPHKCMKVTAHMCALLHTRMQITPHMCVFLHKCKKNYYT